MKTIRKRMGWFYPPPLLLVALTVVGQPATADICTPATLDAQMNLTIPCAEYNGELYQGYFEYKPQGNNMFWEHVSHEKSTCEGDEALVCGRILGEFKEMVIPNILVNGTPHTAGLDINVIDPTRWGIKHRIHYMIDISKGENSLTTCWKGDNGHLEKDFCEEDSWWDWITGGGASCTDGDSDGLTDSCETIIGTNPFTLDTDGDHFPDNEEFNDRESFNPLIAEQPILQFEVLGNTSIILYKEVEETAEQVEVSTVTTEQAKSTEESDSSGHEISASLTISHEVEAEASLEGASTSVTDKIELTAGYGYTTQHTSTTTKEDREAYQKAVENSRSQSENITGGNISVDVHIQNIGQVGVKSSNLTLMASWPPTEGSINSIIATLEYDKPLSVSPDDDVPSRVRFTADIDTDTALALMKNPNSVVYQIGKPTMEVQDLRAIRETGRAPWIDFAGIDTSIKSNTAVVYIDLGEGTIGNYSVAVKKPDGSWRTMKEVMAIIGHQYKTTVDGKITEICKERFTSECQAANYIALDPEKHQRWLVLLATKRPEVTKTYLAETSFDDLELKNTNGRDAIYIIRVTDEDDDGVSLREERLYGSSDTKGNSDSDRDGLTDYEEIREGWTVSYIGSSGDETPYRVFSDPGNPDKDSDNLTDKEEKDKQTDPLNSDTDGDGLRDDEDPEPTINAYTRYTEQGDTLHAGKCLWQQDSLKKGDAKLELQQDGQLVVSVRNSTKWTNDAGKGRSNVRACMQYDGQFVITSGKDLLWSTSWLNGLDKNVDDPDDIYWDFFNDEHELDNSEYWQLRLLEGSGYGTYLTVVLEIPGVSTPLNSVHAMSMINTSPHWWDGLWKLGVGPIVSDHEQLFSGKRCESVFSLTTDPATLPLIDIGLDIGSACYGLCNAPSKKIWWTGLLYYDDRKFAECVCCK